jgi:hypothetical protein
MGTIKISITTFCQKSNNNQSDQNKEIKMKSKKYAMFSLIVVLCLLVMPRLTATAHDQPQWKQANAVPPNELMANASALVEFKGDLYAGTTGSASFLAIPSAIYRSKDGKTWKKVSPDGFGDPANNNVIVTMVVFREKLYVGTGSWDTNTAKAQLWRTSNGTDWEPVTKDGFDGDSNSFMVFHLDVFQNMLYSAVVNWGKGVQLYRSTTGNPGSWVKATTIFDDPQYATQGVYGVITFNDRLYMALGWWDAGMNVAKVGVFRSQDGATWEPVTTDGFGDTTNNNSGAFAIYKGQLYWGSNNDAAGGQIWRSQDGKHWTNLMKGGFGDINNSKISNFMPYMGDLYAFTSNGITGAEVWRTADLKNWEQVNQDGFDATCQNAVPWTVTWDCDWSTPDDRATLIFKGSLYVGSFNPLGGEIWKLDGHH